MKTLFVVLLAVVAFAHVPSNLKEDPIVIDFLKGFAVGLGQTGPVDALFDCTPDGLVIMQNIADAAQYIYTNYQQDLEGGLGQMLCALYAFIGGYEDPCSLNLPALLAFYDNVKNASIASLTAKFNLDPSFYISYLDLALQQYANQQYTAFGVYLGMCLRLLFSP